MAPRPRYTLIFARVAREHFEQIEQKYHRGIVLEIEQQLVHTPGLPTRNHKILRQPGLFGARWEVRVGLDNRFRVFYEIDESARVVRILAVGVKTGNKLRIGKEEINL